ncbi:MAG: ABC transporter ATP-binding protein [Mycoplasma sp.]
MKFLIKLLKPLDWFILFISCGFIVLQVWLDLEMPEYMKKITDILTTDPSNIKEIGMYGGIMIALTVSSVISAVIVAIFVARISAILSARIRSKIFGKVQSFSMEEINKFSIPSLITRSTNDIEQIQMVTIFGLQSMIKAPILAIWALTKISSNGTWEWPVSVGVAVGILLLIIICFVLIVLPKFKKMQKLTDDLNNVSREKIVGIRVVRAYNAEAYQEEKFENANNNLSKTNLFTNKGMAILFPSVEAIISLLSLAIYWIGATTMIKNGSTLEMQQTFSNMVVFANYSVQILFAVLMMVMIFMFLPRAIISLKRINEVMNTKSNIIDGEKTSKDVYSKNRGTLEFKNVNFKYPNAEDYVLKNINFSINKGETIAFIGSTGSGKSTIANLIPRFFDASSGDVLINGNNVKEYKQTDLRDFIGYVSQKPKLFSGTISSNIAFGEKGNKKPSKIRIKWAAEIAQSKSFIEKTEKKYENFVAQDGTNYSGGQKQRISIARAIARKPDFLIFDDSFSALDYKTDRSLRESINKNIKDSTIIIIAQRIGTIMKADKIVVLENGEIAGIGKHKELLKECSVYQEIALSQLSKEELENE